MAAPTIGRRARWAPGRNARVDWSHPLAPGWCASGLVDSHGQTGTLTTGVSTLNAPTPFGVGFSTSTASTGGIQWPVPPTFRPTAALTMVVWASVDGLNANNNVLCLIRENSTDAAPYMVAGMYESAATAGTLDAAVNASGTFKNLASTIASAVPTGLGMRQYVGVFNASANVFSFYRDGTLFGSSTFQTPISVIEFPATPPGITVMGYGTNTLVSGIQGSCAFAAIYGRALTAGDVAALYADPFCFLRQ